MQARRAGSVELNGAAVVLTVLALLLRGAHEAAQKVPWKQTQGPSGARRLHAVSNPCPGNPTFHGAVFPGPPRVSGNTQRDCKALAAGERPRGPIRGTQHGSLTALEDRRQNHVPGRSPSSGHTGAHHTGTSQRGQDAFTCRNGDHCPPPRAATTDMFIQRTTI